MPEPTTVNSDWIRKPTCPGAYWVKDLALNAYKIGVVITAENQLWFTFTGVEGGILVSDFPTEGYQFFGPLSLPNGHCKIYDNGVYQEVEMPVEPQDEGTPC
jgi:hypothetical protein